MFKHSSHTGRIAQNRKENGGFTAEYAVIAPRTLPSGTTGRKMTAYHSPVIARFYWTKGGTCHACVWINALAKGVHVSGGGKAGGYGYHKASAALQAALDDAGVTLPHDISGRGDSAMTDALALIAKALGFRRFHIHHSHA